MVEISTGIQRTLALGRVVATPGALDCLAQDDIRSAIKRHRVGDWGEVNQEDKQENDFAFSRELRILSAYRSSNGSKFWIITEADRSATTILLPEEY